MFIILKMEDSMVLFLENFNYQGDTSLARFYFKDIDGAVRDVFFVRSNN